MAIAGLHNIPMFDSHSQVSRQQLDGSRSRTQASTVRQMWRDLEDENVARNNKERLTVVGRQETTDMFNDDVSCTSLTESHGNDNTSDFGELGENYFDTQAWSGLRSPNENEESDTSTFDRERPRLIFQEWENNSGRGHVSCIPRINRSSKAQWLGENGCERVRVTGGSAQLNSQRRGSCSDSTQNQTAETGAQNEVVPDGVVLNNNEGRPNHMQRRLRRLCGRQALVDMLAKAETERRKELQGLLEFGAVSQFPHRTRIQSLLKSRFLRSTRVAEEPRPKSTAASELGLLTHRQTVSGLREGFITRLDKSVHGQLNSNQIDTSSDSVSDTIINEEAQGSSSRGICDETYEQRDNTNKEKLSDHVDDLVVHTVEDRNGEDSNGHEEALENQEREGHQEPCVNLAVECVDGNREGSHSVEPSQESSGNEVLECSQHHETRETLHGISDSSSEENNYQASSESDSRSEENNFRPLSEIWDDHGSNTSADTYSQESTAQANLQERVTHNDEIDMQHNPIIGFSDLNNDGGEEVIRNWQGSTVSDSSGDMIGEESRQHRNLLDMNEREDESEVSAEDWVDRSYQSEAIPVSRDDSVYPHDDDNAHNGELRDLLSRRRVSSLLQSGFRESLDRLIQSYADRQSNAPIDWEVEHDPPSEDQNDASLDTFDSPSVQTPPQPTRRLIDQVLSQDSWSRHNMHQLDWDIINDMRIDMGRLHHRMDTLQKMLETCMDMQLELQRSIRQEVSAALNRSSVSPESGDTIPNDKSRWDNVRKGICCICSENNIDSLLYRCGHLCTCSNCANQLVQDKGKCPMCQAPVIELIRAYSI